MAEGGEGRTKKICYDRETNSSLPLDLVTEILMRLPGKSISVSKCVCKSWKSIIEDPYFFKKQLNRTSVVTFVESIIEDPYFFKKQLNRTSVVTFVDPDYFHVGDNIFNVVGSSEGRVLRKRGTFKYRVKNPATRQVLCLPNPVKGPGLLQYTYVSGSMVYKLVHLYAKRRGSQDLGCEVLVVGEDLAWRGLNIPSLKNICGGNPRLFSGFDDSDMFHIIRIAKDGLSHSIISLNLVTEFASCYEIPREFFMDWNNVYPLMWKGNLSLTTIVEDKLTIWVLENYKINQWADREIIIPLTSAKAYIKAGAKVCASALSGNLLYIDVNDEIFMSYDIEDKKILSVGTSPIFKKSLLKLKSRRKELGGRL